MAFHCLGPRGVAEMEYTYSGFCACVLILKHGHGVLKLFSSLCCTSSTIYFWPSIKCHCLQFNFFPAKFDCFILALMHLINAEMWNGD